MDDHCFSNYIFRIKPIRINHHPCPAMTPKQRRQIPCMFRVGFSPRIIMLARIGEQIICISRTRTSFMNVESPKTIPKFFWNSLYLSSDDCSSVCILKVHPAADRIIFFAARYLCGSCRFLIATRKHLDHTPSDSVYETSEET